MPMHYLVHRTRRIASLRLCLAALAALAVPSILPAQVSDNRPVYYVMLKSLEDAFEAYNLALASELGTRASALEARYDAERLGFSGEYERLQTERSARESQFNAEREVLNERIAALNERITLRAGRIEEERRIQRHHSPRYATDPRISALKERIAAQLAAIDAVRLSYLAQLQATDKARAALTRQIEEYVSAGDPLALEIRALKEDWQHFAEEERGKLKKLADAYAVDYAAYDKWLRNERASIDELRAALASLQETDREQRALHGETQALLRASIDEYNALVEEHNQAGVNDAGRDQRAESFAALEARITELQATLSDARNAVVRANKALQENNQALNDVYARFKSAKIARDATLAADLAEINASRLAAEAAIDARRAQVDAQVKSLEAHISSELRDARENLEALNARMVDAFGRDHGGFDAAITRVIEMNDSGLLYTAGGAPQFDLSRPMTAQVYSAVEQLDADRSAIDARIAAIEKSDGGAPVKAGSQPEAAQDLERELAGANTERQRLLEAYAASARESQARTLALDKRLAAANARFAEERARLTELYSARANLTRAEMQAVQRVLVAAAKGASGPVSKSGDYARFLDALRDKAAHMNPPARASLLAPHALLDGLGARLTDPGTGADAGSWVAFASRKITASRELAGTDKRAVAAAWLERLRRQADFARMRRQLQASDAVANAGQALSSLFLNGVMEHTAIIEQRLDDGALGIQVSVLGRDYQLDADGSLAPLPKR
jgi:hypothetical protein